MNVRKTMITQLALCLALAGTAAAENNYPGFQCVALTGAVRIDSAGHVQNNSTTTTATVMCPVAVDASTSGLASSGDPHAYVTDQNFDTNVCCSSRLKNTGQSITSGGTQCSSGTNTASQTLALNNAGTSGGNFTFTHRWIQCDLPPLFSGAASEIRTYRY